MGDKDWQIKRALPQNISAKDLARFWNYVEKGPDCWAWAGNMGRRNYGRFYIGKKAYMAHRLSFYLETGKQPGELLVCHRCDNPSCVRPSHLFLGTQRDNIRDCVTKGRHQFAAKTHCHRGHKLPEIRKIRPQGWNARICRDCARIDARNRRKNKPVAVRTALKVYRDKVRAEVYKLLTAGLSQEQIIKKTGRSALTVKRASGGFRG